MVVPGSDHFFVAKVQTLLSAILAGVVGTVGTIFMEEPCTRAIYYAPMTILFTGESILIGNTMHPPHDYNVSSPIQAGP